MSCLVSGSSWNSTTTATSSLSFACHSIYFWSVLESSSPVAAEIKQCVKNSSTEILFKAWEPEDSQISTLRPYPIHNPCSILVEGFSTNRRLSYKHNALFLAFTHRQPFLKPGARQLWPSKAVFITQWQLHPQDTRCLLLLSGVGRLEVVNSPQQRRNLLNFIIFGRVESFWFLALRLISIRISFLFNLHSKFRTFLECLTLHKRALALYNIAA